MTRASFQDQPDAPAPQRLAAETLPSRELPSKEPVKEPGTSPYGAAAVELQVTQLMGRTKAGDRAAFDELVGLLRTRSFRLARSLVGSPEDALDLTQEAFLRAYRSRASYRDGDAFLPWFHRILRNTCFSHLRRRGLVERRSLSGSRDEDDGEWTLPDDEPPPSAGMEADEQAGTFWAAFRALRATDREILSLRHFEELSYRDIAERLEIPEGTVMSRLFHARRRLREELGQRSLSLDEPLATGERSTLHR
jgi:RNA polymerase sigma-70 factor (ECF subfamily)